MKSIKITLIAFLAVAIVFAVNVLIKRHRTESGTPLEMVQVCIDFKELDELCAVSGKSIDEGIKDFSGWGVNGVFFEFDTLKTLIDSGNCIKINNKYVFTGDYDTEFIDNIFISVLGKNKYKSVNYNDYHEISFESDCKDLSFLESIPIGMNKKYIKSFNVNNVPYNIVARIGSFSGLSEKSIDLIFDYLKKNNISQIVFSGDSVLGFKGLEKYTAQKMKENNVIFGKIEFTDQKGSNVISKINRKNTVWVHTIPVMELVGMNEVSMIERFVKSVRERNVKILFVRMPYSYGNDIYKQNLQFYEKLFMNLGSAGCMIGSAQNNSESMPDIKVQRIWIGFGVGCIFFILCNLLWKFEYRKNILFLILCILFGGIFTLSGMSLKIITLLLGCSVPILAVVYFYKKNVRNILLSILGIFGIVFYGGILNAALLSEPDYMIRNTVFAGIKIAHFIPLLAVALILGFGLIDKKLIFRESLFSLRTKIKELFSQPLLIGTVAVGFLILILIGLMLARSGNDSGLAVSAFELKFRSLLDKIVYVRPRTKEFLLGYPCLILGFWYLKNNKKVLSNVFLTLGTISLVSLFNTFCHIHTPIFLGIIRSFNGLWTGIVIGIFILLIIKNIFHKESKLW